MKKIKTIVSMIIVIVMITASITSAYADGSWICFGCGTENNGNFCGSCGMSRADSDIETAAAKAACSHEESIICMERSEKWYCLSCGAVISTDFCTNCGYKRDGGMVGSFVYLGAYEQDNNEANGPEEIEWIVLEDNGDSALIISRYALDCEPFDVNGLTNVWKDCTLRKWLNMDFYNTAFTPDEQQHISTATVKTKGTATEDQVFLLATDGAKEYFKSSDSRKCAPISLAIAKGAYVSDSTECCWWWLRSPGDYSNYAAYVDIDGDVYDRDVDRSNYAVRPALFVKY